MQAEIRKTNAGLYELGGKIDGVFVAFYSRDAAEIDAAVANAKDTKKQSKSASDENSE